MFWLSFCTRLLLLLLRGAARLLLVLVILLLARLLLLLLRRTARLLLVLVILLLARLLLLLLLLRGATRLLLALAILLLARLLLRIVRSQLLLILLALVLLSGLGTIEDLLESGAGIGFRVDRLVLGLRLIRRLVACGLVLGLSLLRILAVASLGLSAGLIIGLRRPLALLRLALLVRGIAALLILRIARFALGILLRSPFPGSPDALSGAADLWTVCLGETFVPGGLPPSDRRTYRAVAAGFDRCHPARRRASRSAGVGCWPAADCVGGDDGDPAFDGFAVIGGRRRLVVALVVFRFGPVGHLIAGLQSAAARAGKGSCPRTRPCGAAAGRSLFNSGGMASPRFSFSAQRDPPQAEIGVGRPHAEFQLAIFRQLDVLLLRLHDLHVGRQIGDHFDAVTNGLAIFAAVAIDEVQLVLFVFRDWPARRPSCAA